MLTSDTDPLTVPADTGANTALNVVLLPALIVAGTLNPVMLKPTPGVTLACVIVSVAVPPFVRLIVCELLFPVTTFPKLALVGFADNCGWMPVPESGIVAGDPGALLVIEMLPLAVPAVVGANVVVKEAFAPALMLVGTANPLRLNPVPLALAAVIVRVAFPVLVKVMLCGELAPTSTLPKFTLAGLIESWACVATPVPLSAIVRGEPGALLVIEMLPLALPATVGANFAVKDVFCPAFRVIGVANPLMLKPLPEGLAPDIVTLAVPVFVSVTPTDPLLPTSRFPKLTPAGLAESCPWVPVPVRAIIRVGLVAVLVMVIEPATAPGVVGANWAVNDVVCPAPKFNGRASPLTLNPAPLALACEIVTFVLPVFVSVTVCGLELPTTTLLKAMLPGFATNVAFDATPLPARLRVCGESGAPSVNTMLPVTPAAVVGANCTLNDAL